MRRNRMCTTFIVQDGLNTVYVASQEGHTEIVDVLVRAGANVNQATEVYVHNIHAHVHNRTRGRTRIYFGRGSIHCEMVAGGSLHSCNNQCC